MALVSCSAQHISESGDSSSNRIVENPNPDPALAEAAANLLGSKCIVCHGAAGTNQIFLNTAANPGLETLKGNSRYVKIGQGSSSLLYRRVLDGSMPPGAPLTSQESEAIRVWIDDLGIVPEDPDEDSTTTFAYIEENILIPKCYVCHDGHATYDFGDYDDLLFGYVIPGDLDSALYRVITTGSVEGNIMPKGREPLSAAEILSIETWILNGAVR